MRHYRFAMYVSDKLRAERWATSVSAGARVHGDEVVIVPNFTDAGNYEPIESIDGACVTGLSRASKRVFNDYLARGQHVLFFDKGYTNRNQSYWRISVDAWQPLAYFQRAYRPFSRFEKLEIELSARMNKPEDGKHIIVVGVDQKYNNYFDLGDVNETYGQLLKDIRKYTDREVIYRLKPGWVEKRAEKFKPLHETIRNARLSVTEPFVDLIENAHVIVSHGSSAAIGGLIRGVPALTLGPGAVRPISELRIERIENPFKPKRTDRAQFFADLAWCQWTPREHEQGEAWAEIREVLAYLNGDIESTPDGEKLIEQYKVMHENHKYFRGRGTAKYVDIIGGMVAATQSKTLLDYGSGKGQQYEGGFCLQDTWGVEVTCYDPGVPKFAALPDGVFDGAICCDVMEHIPEGDVDKTLKEIFARASKFAFFAIATRPATKKLPDGRNCHVTVKPIDWWQKRVDQLTPEGMLVKVVDEEAQVDWEWER